MKWKSKTRITDMTSGSPAYLIMSFSVPLILGNIFQQLYTVTDTAIVGKSLGVQALAALGSVDWFNWMVLGIIQGLSQGFSIRISQDFGSSDEKSMKKSIGNSITLAVFSSFILLILAQLMVEPGLFLLKIPLEIRSMARVYLRIMFIGAPILMAYNMAASILRALGDGKTPLMAMIAASATNIILDILFVAYFKMGVPGAAYATLIAQGLSAVYCMVKIRGIEILKLQKEAFLLDSVLARKLLLLGLPMVFQNIIISIGGMIVQMIVDGFGVVFIAGMTATNKLYGLLEVAATSYGFAMVTYTGQNLGAGKKERIRQGLRWGLLIAMITSAIITAIMFLFGRNIVGLFISASPEVEKEALDIAYLYLRIMSAFLPVLYVLHVTRSCIQGMGDTVIPMVSGFAEFIMRTTASFLLPVLFGKTGIMFAEIFAWTGADLVLIPGYFYNLSKREPLPQK